MTENERALVEAILEPGRSALQERYAVLRERLPPGLVDEVRQAWREFARAKERLNNLSTRVPQFLWENGFEDELEKNQ